MKRRTKKQLAQQLAREEIRRVKKERKVNRKAAYRREIALLGSIEDIELRLHSTVIVEPHEEAIITANNAFSLQLAEIMIYFVGGSVKRGMSEPGKLGSSRSTGFVTCRSSSEVETWKSTSFIVTCKVHASVKQAEMVAIAGAMAKAASAMSAQQPSDETTHPRVLIFSDCRSALNRIESYRYDAPCRENLVQNEIARRIITSSKVLWDLGAQVELRWVPGHHMKAHSKTNRMIKEEFDGFSDVCVAEYLRKFEERPEVDDTSSTRTEPQASIEPETTKRNISLKFDSVKECYILFEARAEYSSTTDSPLGST